MANGKLYEYAILYHPKPKKDKNGVDIDQKSEMVSPLIKHVVALDEKQAGILIARTIPEEYVDKLDSLEIIIRPFLSPR